MFILLALLMGFAHFGVERRLTFARTRLLFWLIALKSIGVSQVSSSFANLALNINSFSNVNNMQKNGLCCDGSTPIWSVAPPCSKQCNTLFLVCVGVYTSNSYATWHVVTSDDQQQCSFTYGQLGPFSTSNVNQANVTLSLGSIPNAFSFQIVAWNMITNNISSASLLAVYYVNDNAVVKSVSKARSLSDSPSVSTVVPVSTNIAFSYVVQCPPNFYGSLCSQYCNPRDDSFGHYICLSDGSMQCLAGWSGASCTTPVCSAGCDPILGSCTQPFTCQCQPGWSGRNCTECVPYPGCSSSHGYCVKPYECLCHSGWVGSLCDQDVSFCNNNPCLNGGTCRINFTAVEQSAGSSASASASVNASVATYSWYSCLCPPGYAGTTCQIALSSWTQNCSQLQAQQCQNGASCQVNVSRNGNSTVSCQCPPAFSGPTCATNDSLCTPNPCLNGATCSSANATVMCACTAGYSGALCRSATTVMTATSASTKAGICSLNPCSNYEICVEKGDGNFDCVCKAAYNGTYCNAGTSTPSSSSLTESVSSSTLVIIIVVGIVFPIIVIVIILVVVFTRRWLNRSNSAQGDLKKGKDVEPDANNAVQRTNNLNENDYCNPVRVGSLRCDAGTDDNLKNQKIDRIFTTGRLNSNSSLCNVAPGKKPVAHSTVQLESLQPKCEAHTNRLGNENFEMFNQKPSIAKMPDFAAPRRAVWKHDESTAYRSDSVDQIAAPMQHQCQRHSKNVQMNVDQRIGQRGSLGKQASAEYDTNSLSTMSNNTTSVNLSPRCNRPYVHGDCTTYEMTGSLNHVTVGDTSMSLSMHVPTSKLAAKRCTSPPFSVAPVHATQVEHALRFTDAPRQRGDRHLHDNALNTAYKVNTFCDPTIAYGDTKSPSRPPIINNMHSSVV